jgi:acetyl-CoA carboxylase biotin carboxylase subunit
LNKILIANRGEIAVRVIRACRELGLRSIAVYSECDRTALHVRLADEAYLIGPNPAIESYLNSDRLVDVARRAGADAVHPGYGFLAENEGFADACRNSGLIFIGPSPEAIATMGSKTSAREIAVRAGVPVVPGTTSPLSASVSSDELVARAAEVGYPLLVKAVAGGGGKGMRAVDSPTELLAAIRTARSEAQSSFGDSSVYFERRLLKPRHVEVQLLGDSHGTILPFVERECSIQRRHQKLIEETPSLAVSAALRKEMTSAAARIAGLAGYTNAGTIEFLLEESTGRAYFLEMNTRLQVEHPITEIVTGIDLVAAQIAIARGERLTFDARRLLEPNGHAIECRVYAEDADADFLPSPGRITFLRPPAGPGVRDDSGMTSGSEIPVFYDSLVSKVTSWGDNRSVALARMARALAEYEIRGIKTTVPFFRRLLEDADFQSGRFDTTFVDRVLAGRGAEPAATISASDRTIALMAVALQALHAEEGGTTPPADGWKHRARIEALREWPTT